MLIGLTYDLRQDYLDAGFSEEETAEFDRPDTIEAIEYVLRQMGHETDRIGRVTTLVERLARGDRWDMVFNIAEGLHGIGREAQVPALLDAYEVPYTFSDPLVCALTLHKGMAKRIVRDLGLPTANFTVVEHESAVSSMAQASCLCESNQLQFPLFAKPVAEGTSKGITRDSKIKSPDQLARTCCALLQQFKQPVLVEEYLPGREVTVGIVGTGNEAMVVGVMEVLLLHGAEQEGYSYQNKKNWEDKITYQLVKGALRDEAESLALAAWRGLGCRDGGRVDLRADATGKFNFIEVNPLPGINPVLSDLSILSGLAGWNYRHLIERIVTSAIKRVHASRTLSTA
jgi:D-alanine-D-alanine ligase